MFLRVKDRISIKFTEDDMKSEELLKSIKYDYLKEERQNIARNVRNGVSFCAIINKRCINKTKGENINGKSNEADDGYYRARSYSE